jgi:hypothetical protein
VRDTVRAGRDAARVAREELEARLAEAKAGARGGADAVRARHTTATAGDELEDEAGA